jgi:HEAT repeat protein/energy-coupling factor transporter ATP-binding protein EcfA2
MRHTYTLRKLGLNCVLTLCAVLLASPGYAAFSLREADLDRIISAFLSRKNPLEHRLQAEILLSKGNVNEIPSRYASGLLATLKEADVRCTAALLLAKIEDREKQSEIISALKTEFQRLRIACIGVAMLKIDANSLTAIEALPVLREAMTKGELRYEIASVLTRFGPAAESAIPELIFVSRKDADESTRAEAIRALASISGQLPASAAITIPVLISALLNDGPRVAVAVAEATEQFGIEADLLASPLLKRLEKSPSDNPEELIKALGIIGPAADSAAPVISKFLVDTRPYISYISIEAFGRIGIATASDIDILIEKVSAKIDPEYGNVINRTAAAALAELGRAYVSRRDTSRLENLDKALLTLSKSPDRVIRYQGRSLAQSLEQLRIQQSRLTKKKAWEWIESHPGIALFLAIYFGYMLVLFSLYFLKPLALLRLHISVSNTPTIDLPMGIKLPIADILLTRLLVYRRRVLKRWACAHAANAIDHFQKRATVADRHLFVSLPVLVNGIMENGAILDDFLLARNKRKAVLICGEGGSGKTSLACQLAIKMANSTMSPIPILIEDDFVVDKEGLPDFLATVMSQLRLAIGALESVPVELGKALLRQGYIVVIVDGLSEFSLSAQKAFMPFQPDFPVNSLIVTSRTGYSSDGGLFTLIQPIRVNGNQLASFLDNYLLKLGKRFLFDDQEFFKSCIQLSSIVRAGEMTPLLGKLFCEYMVDLKEGNPGQSNPKSVPELILSYISSVAHRSANSVRTDILFRAFRIVSWECLRKTLRPASVRREDLASALVLNNVDAGILATLEVDLTLLQVSGTSSERLRVTLDPIAEYLAAIHVLTQSSEGEFALEVIARVPIEQIESSGLLRSLLDCCLHLSEYLEISSEARSNILSALQIRIESVEPIV